MNSKLFATTMAAAAMLASLGVHGPDPACAGPVDISIQLGAYLPAPPGVRIRIEAGRPYYVENNRRVYMKKKSKGDNGKHLGYEDRGRKKGHGKKNGRD